MKFRINTQKCITCRMCQYVCSMGKGKEIRFDPCRIRVAPDGADGRPRIVTCRQCKRCRCIESCSYDAFKRDRETGGVFIDYAECQACLACLDACVLHAGGHGCRERVPHGLRPVRWKNALCRGLSHRSAGALGKGLGGGMECIDKSRERALCFRAGMGNKKCFPRF